MANVDEQCGPGRLESDVNSFAGASGRADSRGGEMADPVVAFYDRLAVSGHVNGRR